MDAERPWSQSDDHIIAPADDPVTCGAEAGAGARPDRRPIGRSMAAAGGVPSGPRFAVQPAAASYARQRETSLSPRRNEPGEPPPLRLALFGLPLAVAEPVTMLAEILGWEVLHYRAGPAMPPPVQACLAMLPPCGATTNAGAPLVLWSPQSHLNEHISRTGLSIMDQPLCVAQVEQMLQGLACVPWFGRSQYGGVG